MKIKNETQRCEKLQFSGHSILDLEFGIWYLALLIFFNPFFSFSLFAQITQPLQYERPHKGSDHEYIVVPMHENGLCLVQETEKFEDNKRKWTITIVDTTLRETWTTDIEIDHNKNILGHDYRDGNVYLIFEDPQGNGREVNITELLIAEKTVKQHKFKPEVNMYFTHFSVLKNKAVFGAYITKEPALLMYDMTN